MKFILLIVFSTLGFSASAQWYRIDLKLQKKRERFPLIAQVNDNSIARLPVAAVDDKKLRKLQLDFSEFSYDAAIYFAIKKAQHNMRFRVYAEASYNFSELAQLYIHQNKYTEAKWYLLQSNNISREQKDNKHTISNLIDLAMVKANIGDYGLAQQDLAEAHDIASASGFRNDLPDIEDKMLRLKQNKPWQQKPDPANSPFAQNNTRVE